MKLTKFLIAATCAAGFMTTGAVASTVALTNDVGAPAPLAVGPGVPVGQNFVTQLLAAGVTHLYSGPLSITSSEPLKATFSLVGGESSFSNTLNFMGAPIITENFGTLSLPDFTTGALNGETASVIFNGDLAALLSFTSPSFAGAFTSADDEFGVFADSASLGALSVFYLGLDDSGAGDDDNHDDILIRVEISTVPLPAGGLLLLTALGGIAATRRVRANRKS